MRLKCAFLPRYVYIVFLEIYSLYVSKSFLILIPICVKVIII
jgi:hypothetical protein